MALISPRRRARSRWAVLGVTVTILALAVASVAFANLAGSSFEGNDGNLVVNNSGNTDWANVAGLNTGIDNPSGSGDNAFGQGTKEDNAAATVVDGSIPPNKNDLTRFYEASQQISGGDIFLYLGWERLVNIGNANLDFEINKLDQSSTFTSSTTGAVTLSRSAGDILVTYDFGGSGAPSLGLLRWLTSASVPTVTGFTTNACFSANSFPCWGDRIDLTGNGEAEGAVNTGTISEPIAGGNLTAGLFGEAAINLTDAGVFQPGVCSAFGSTFVKSRSSSSFTAEIKDFIAPVPVSISNCGSITIRKVTVNADSTFGYTTTGSGLSSFSLSNGGHTTFTPLQSGSYSVTENITSAQTSAGWALQGISCTTTGAGTSATPNGSTVNITLGLGGTADCTYTNKATGSPSFSTQASPTTSIVVGTTTTVGDTATLSGGYNPGGTFDFALYSDSTCTTAVTGIAQDNIAVSSGSASISKSWTPTTVGTYYWKVNYDGDANNNGTGPSCGGTNETLTVIKADSSISTAQKLLPNDSATIAGYNPGGTVTFKLFAPTDATCSGTASYSEPVTVNGNGTYWTTNTSFYATSAGTWRWLVAYSGDGNNNGSTSACGVEQFTITQP